MAQTANINIKVNTAEAEGAFEGLDTSIQGTEKSTASLRAQLRQVTQELQGLEPGSARFTELSQKAGQLKDTIADTNAVINATAGSGVENLGKGLAGVASIGLNAFQAVQGGMQAFGLEGEALQRSMAKLQGIMAMTQAITALGGLKDSITNIKAAFGAFGKSAVTALQGIKGAVAATGIGLLVIAVGTMVAYWDDIKAAVSGVSKEQEELNKKTQANLDASQKRLSNLKLQENQLRLQGKSEKEILQMKVVAVGTAIKEAKARLASQQSTLKSQIETEKRNYEITKGIIMFLTYPLQMILGTIDKVSEGLAYLGIIDKALTLRDDVTSWAASFLFDPEQVKSEGMKAIAETEDLIKQLESERAGYQLEIQNIEKNAQKERNAINKQEVTDNKKNEEEKAKNALDEKRKLEDSRVALMADGLEKELEMNRLAFERKVEDEIKGEKNLSAQKKEIVDNYNKEKEQVDAEIRKKYSDAELKALEEKKAAELKAIADMKAADEQAYQDEKKLEEQRISQMEDGIEKDKATRKVMYLDRLHQFQNQLDEQKISEAEFQQLSLNEYNKYLEDKEKLDKHYADLEIEKQKKKYEAISAEIQKWGGATMELANSLNELFNQIGENREMKIKENFETENAALKSQLENRLISEAEYEAQLKQMQIARDEESKKIKLKEFRRQKGMNIANAIMNGALAITSILAQYPKFDGGFAMIAALAAAGITNAIQIATISAQQFKAARGGIVPGNGPGNIDSVPSLLAPGEAVINSRSTSMFPRTLDLINQAGGGQPLLPDMAQVSPSGQGIVFGENSQRTQPLRAYVVETEITNTQKRVNRIERSVEF